MYHCLLYSYVLIFKLEVFTFSFKPEFCNFHLNFTPSLNPFGSFPFGNFEPSSLSSLDISSQVHISWSSADVFSHIEVIFLISNVSYSQFAEGRNRCYSDVADRDKEEMWRKALCESHSSTLWEGREIHHDPTGLNLSITKARVPFGLNLFERGAFNMRDGSI